MSPQLTLILVLSTVGLIAGIVFIDFRRKARALSGALVVALAVGVFLLLYPTRVETKGPVDETVAVIICYAAMVLGMFAENGYAQAERGARKFEFVPMDFLMPIFASPIVFIPLLTIMPDVSQGGIFAKAKLMIYLVAFQNGFFWKSFFEQRRQKAAQGTGVPMQPLS